MSLDLFTNNRQTIFTILIVIISFIWYKTMKPGLFKHINCRNGLYSGSKVPRFQVSDDTIDWDIEYPEYQPPYYDSPALKGRPWADPDINDSTFNPKWNEEDVSINRKSFIGKYRIEQKYPLNPFGRTGLVGRGLLGRWGPNHAADPLVTRWKRDLNGQIVQNESGRFTLQMVAIERRDNKMWAIPGGMVDAGEKVSETVRREFREEALASAELSESIESFFKTGIEVYSGYVDDPRNTDNAWMETVVYNFHDEDDKTVGKLNLIAGDDAAKVKWLDIDQNIKLYANHKYFVQKVVERLKAHW